MMIVYLNDYYEKEEAVLKTHGVSCVRIKYPFEDSHISSIEGNFIFRGPKMKAATYSELIQVLEKNNCSALVKLEDFKKISDAIEYTRCFGKYAPKVITFDIGESKENIVSNLRKSDMHYPLFVRSDLESAAKYVGVEACTLRTIDVSAVETVLEPIHKHIASAGTIIMKEIVSVKKSNGKNIEYRAIVVNGQIICFDYDPSSGLPHPDSLTCAWQFGNCIDIANDNGLNGAYFVDFGVDESNNIFVVECKNLMNGTIKNIDAFAEGLVKGVQE